MNKFCVMPWIGLEINNNGNMRPCCVLKRDIVDDDGNTLNINTHYVDDYINSKSLKQLKDDMLSGKELLECSKCYDEEKVNVRSMRVRKNSEFKNSFSLNDNQIDVLSVDLKLSNLCNQKCVICNPNASSMVLAENKEIFPGSNKSYNNNLYHWYKSTEIWNQIEKITDKVEHLDFYGGEPWLIKKHWEFIKHLVESGKSKNISLNYATNGSIHDDKFFTEYFSKFKRVSILYSADGIEDTFEYNRFPGKWETYKENILQAKKFQDNGIIDWIGVAYTVSAYSVHDVINSLNFYKNYDMPVWFNMVNELEYVCGILPDKTKSKIMENIKENWKDDFLLVNETMNYSYFLELLSIDVEQKWKDVFIMNTKKRDKYRNNSFLDLCDDDSLRKFFEDEK